jgi:hypothetical protein
MKEFFKKIWSKLFSKKTEVPVITESVLAPELEKTPEPKVTIMAPTVIIKEVDNTIVPTPEKKTVKKSVKKTAKKQTRKRK